MSNELTTEVKDYFTTEELATRFGVTTKTILERCNKMGLEPAIIEGKPHKHHYSLEQYNKLFALRQEEEVKRKQAIQKVRAAMSSDLKQEVVIGAVCEEMSEDDLHIMERAIADQKHKLRMKELAAHEQRVAQQQALIDDLEQTKETLGKYSWKYIQKLVNKRGYEIGFKEAWDELYEEMGLSAITGNKAELIRGDEELITQAVDILERL
jgi:hypothetical protein